MSKRYIDELGAWVKKRGAKKRRRDEAAVAFLAVKADVETALVAGYALITIWEHMRETGRFKFSYETFRVHAKRHIKIEAGREPRLDERRSQSARKKPQQSKPKKPGSAGTSPGFRFNPNPDKEDLL